MAKRIALIFIVLLVVSGAVFAQERAHNTVALSFGIVGVEASYERMFNRYLSVLGSASATTILFMDEITASVQGRWYPFGRAFHLDLGLGYTYGMGVGNFMGKAILGAMTLGLIFLIPDYIDKNPRKGGLLIQTGLGWKIDVGKPDGFVLPITLGLNFRAAETPDVMPYMRLGLGYAF